MTRDDIIKMALEAGISGPNHQGLAEWFGATTPEMERFAALVAADEREACAKLCEAEAEKWEGDDGPISTEARLCALVIRARGTP